MYRKNAVFNGKQKHMKPLLGIVVVRPMPKVQGTTIATTAQKLTPPHNDQKTKNKTRIVKILQESFFYIIYYNGVVLTQ